MAQTSPLEPSLGSKVLWTAPSVDRPSSDHMWQSCAGGSFFEGGWYGGAKLKTANSHETQLIVTPKDPVSACSSTCPASPLPASPPQTPLQPACPDGSEDEGSRKRRRTDEESSEGGTDAGSSPSTSDEANQQQPLRPEGESAPAVTSRSGRTGRLKRAKMFRKIETDPDVMLTRRGIVRRLVKSRLNVEMRYVTVDHVETVFPAYDVLLDALSYNEETCVFAALPENEIDRVVKEGFYSKKQRKQEGEASEVEASEPELMVYHDPLLAFRALEAKPQGLCTLIAAHMIWSPDSRVKVVGDLKAGTVQVPSSARALLKPRYRVTFDASKVNSVEESGFNVENWMEINGKMTLSEIEKHYCSRSAME